MAVKTPKRYQEKAIEKLIQKSEWLFEDEDLDKRTIVLQSPTGSGKTFMMSLFIQELIEKFDKKDLCFLWLSIGKGNLHVQSYDSLKKEFQGFPECHLLEQEFFGSRKTINKNEVVVVNWEKLRTKDRKTGKWKNILMKDKETVNFRELLQNTRESGKTIVMIIDESHASATTERALELRDEIVNSDLTIEMSATPVLREGQYNEKVTVQPNDVIQEGMIKKEIIINEDIEKIEEDEITSQELIMEKAYQKRLQLAKQYKKEGIEVNPLVLIQLPTSKEGQDKKDFVEGFLAGKGVTYASNKLAVWLSEEKVNNEKEFVTPNQSDVEFLIFKQAIDTGWDCPRAQVLVRFREIKSIVFEIQTVGRILRMPEAKHYQNDNLNKGFVYTNVKSLEVRRETYNPNIIKSVLVKRKDIYKPLKLRSYYRHRIDYGDITASFYQVLEKVFCDYFDIEKGKFEYGMYEDNKNKLKEKIYVKNLDAKDSLIADKPLPSRLFDYLPEEKIESDPSFQVKLSQNDLFYAFEHLIEINLNGFAPKRSIPTVKQATYNWFKKYLNIKLVGNGIIYIQNLCLNNAEVFSKLFDKAVKEYKPIKDKEVKEKIKKLEKWDNDWEIAESRNYNPHTYTDQYKRKDNGKIEDFDDFELSLYEPCRLNIDSDIEVDFIKFLEEHKDDILWWWQNGNEHMELNFGIKYGKDSTFQPDFLVMFKDERLGIFDTKASGDREANNKVKGEALQQYIKEENEKDKNLIGGLVIKEGEHFWINSTEEYESFSKSPNDWNYLEDSVFD
jgi:type III restriction enzyme